MNNNTEMQQLPTGVMTFAVNYFNICTEWLPIGITYTYEPFPIIVILELECDTYFGLEGIALDIHVWFCRNATTGDFSGC